MEKFTVFANFNIDGEERFLRMQDSFFSFYKSNILEWHINVSGDYKEKVKKFLEKNILQNINVYFLESAEGWIFDSKKICSNIRSNIVFLWIEDHICIKNFSIINLVVQEMQQNNIQYTSYTFFHKGKNLKPLISIEHEKKKYLSYFEYNTDNYKKIEEFFKRTNLRPDYLISACSFIDINLLKKNFHLSEKKKKYNKMLPFNFEKSFFENAILPFKNGILNEELFVSIDDDHKEEGYSLISRNLYPNRVSKKDMDLIRTNKIKIYEGNIFLASIKNILNFFKK